ncbi:coiled-coil domain-containing protein 25 isoform X4 [Lagenorhynchus albirostris]|uniref:coiled-coil domain-containing protein 25 isoform X4 n=1 Tax=Lagenorhynchus albirostris TaxID=27610 RepID=UPI0028E3EE08|nr:coiled-coil domain-containing protein 25 isoform X4 [Lagenorhynchus albirostris]
MLRSEEDCLCCCKMNNVNVVYTPWSNLKKTADMDVGQIGFHRQKDVKIVTVEKKVNEILNRLEKTKMERFPDLEAEKECRDREERNEKKAQIQEMKRKEKEEMKKKREMDELRSYSSLMKVENMSSNQQVCDSWEMRTARRVLQQAHVQVGLRESSSLPSARGPSTGQETRVRYIISQTTCMMPPTFSSRSG